MDIGPTTRPVPSVASAPLRVDVTPVQGAVATDLPATDAVSAAGQSEPARIDLTNRSRTLFQSETAVKEEIRRRTEVDKDANVLVYRATDMRTGEVVQQYPDEALLKLRAYARAQMASETRPEKVEVTA